MTFVDTNVVMYAVGRPHPLREPAREFFADAARRRWALCTSAEVLQELAHAYLPVQRESTLDSAMALVVRAGIDVWPLEADGRPPGLAAAHPVSRPRGPRPLSSGELPASAA